MRIRASIDEGWIGKSDYQFINEGPSSQPSSITALAKPDDKPLLYICEKNEWWAIYNKSRMGFRR